MPRQLEIQGTRQQSPNFDEHWRAARGLADQFGKNLKLYMSADFQEAEVRKYFLDKFFKAALGWDVDHERQADPYRREVRIERSDKLSKGRADYAFYVSPYFSRVRFLVEAKRPLPDIATPDNCFQAIRYSWPKGLPIVVLTDFNSFHVIDSRFRPNINSAVSRVVRTWHFSDFHDRDKFAELFFLLSRDAVAGGSIEIFAETQLPTAEIATRQYTLFPNETRPFDDDFLDELDGWRQSLGSIFKAADPRLDGDQLTECVQRTLDRLVFIRFLEDKLIEPDPLIAKFGSRNRTHWHDFVAASKRLDKVYNGIVFKHHPILDNPEFQPDSGVFSQVCDELTDEHSPYNFDSIPVEILGRIYERFLGSIVQVKGNRVSVVQKENVRKAGGVYYTPDYIVGYIVEQTIGEEIRGKHPDDILRLRIIDTSCGSGSFLIAAFDRLLQTLTAYWRAHGRRPKGIAEERDGDVHLTLQYKRLLLLNCIYGVDIDAQAVEVAQLSLYLKLMEDETTNSVHQQQMEIEVALLPSLSRNIVIGNSLVTIEAEGSDLFVAEKLSATKSLDFRAAFPQVFRAGGFDFVIGNPPYIKEYTSRAAFDHVRSSPYYMGKMDIWYLFACRGMDWLKASTGQLAFIATNNWVTNAGAKRLRGKITRDGRIEQLIDFGDFKVFRDADIQTMILIVRRSPDPNSYQFDYRRLTGKRGLNDAQGLLARIEGPGRQYLTPTFNRERNDAEAPFTFAGSDIEQVLEKIASGKNFDLAGDDEIAQGIVPNPDVVTRRSIDLIPARRRASNGIVPGTGVFVVENGHFARTTEDEADFLKPLYEPSDVVRYAIMAPASKQIIYSTRANTAARPLPKRLLAHLEQFREIMEQRRENKLDRISFYNLHWPREERFFLEGSKILAVRKCDVPTFAYTDKEAYAMMAFNIIKSDRLDLRFLTALLNSRVVKFWLRHRGKMQGGNYQIDKEPLVAIPLRVPDEAEQERIGDMVAKIVELQQKQSVASTDSRRTQLARLASELDERIQEEIETLYSLTSTERELIGA